MAERKIRAARSLRQRETDLERRLWQALRGRRVFGLKFRRQHPVGPYVADFACLEARLLIEIDGYWHAKKKSADAARDRHLRAQGFDVVRFDIENESADVETLAEMIAHEARCGSGGSCSGWPTLTPCPSPSRSGRARGNAAAS